jgi:type II secretory pathway pseudopilin PulG
MALLVALLIVSLIASIVAYAALVVGSRSDDQAADDREQTEYLRRWRA